jgi:hypothetical protein
MEKSFITLNLICVVTTNIAINTYGTALFGLGELPDWAIESAALVNTNCTRA